MSLNDNGAYFNNETIDSFDSAMEEVLHECIHILQFDTRPQHSSSLVHKVKIGIYSPHPAVYFRENPSRPLDLHTEQHTVGPKFDMIQMKRNFLVDFTQWHYFFDQFLSE